MEHLMIEADLEEVYFYKIDKPAGYAYPRVYTDANSPLQQVQAAFAYPADKIANEN